MPEERFLGNTDVGINKEVSFPGFGNQLDATQKGEGFINEGFCKCPVGPLLPGKCFCENWIKLPFGHRLGVKSQLAPLPCASVQSSAVCGSPGLPPGDWRPRQHRRWAG